MVIAGIIWLLIGIYGLFTATKTYKRIYDKYFKDSFCDNHLRRRWFFEERLSEKTNRIVEIVFGIILGTAFIVFGVGLLIKGIAAM